MENQKPSLRAVLHYLSAALILAVYGVQVCPFLETLTVTQLVLPIILVLGVQFILRGPLRRRYVESAPYQNQTLGVFRVEYGLFLASGTFLMVFNTALHGFPLTSGLKIIVGLATLGFFAAIDLALEWQRRLVDYFCRTGHHMQVDENFFPLTGKLGLFASISVVFIMGVVVLVINKDLIWLSEVGRTMSYEKANMLILAEVAFVIGIILAHVLNVIYSYVRNLRGFLDSENGVLKQATGGELNGFVPVGTNDEFGIMAIHTNEMIKGLRETTEEIRRTRDVSILTLASLAETRDNETGAHILRTQRYVKALALHLQGHPDFSDELTDENIDLLYKSAPLHDIGKVGIPDHILLKPGKLTAEEFEIMKTHPTLGYQALKVAEKEMGSNSFLHFAREISLSHHEKWDGSGYPSGLKGDAIPVSGRLMAVADVYDALISKRVYKKAFTHDDARNVLLEGKGAHFDPDVIEAFLAVEDEFLGIAAEFSDKAYSGTENAALEEKLAIA
ncbi:MAG: HD domain-containing protein [Rhodospirillales bacterium]|nr:HD domain-containing protein [Rhodospirillales bacterium]